MPDTEQAASMRFPELQGKSLREVASFWLTDPIARAALNEQLAELLRAYVEGRLPSRDIAFRQCPFCGEQLREYEQPDIWVQGLRCRNAHSWASRGNWLGTVVDGRSFGVHSELQASTVRQLIGVWLKGGPFLDTQVHKSVHQVLEGTAEAFRVAS
ncbi:MAG: hypothetical protein ACRD4G_09815 [Bryobacteraceae bacterium]